VLASEAGPTARLTWSLLDTQLFIGDDGEQHQSAVIELAVEGGQPGTVTLGRHDADGCAVAGTNAGTNLVCSPGPHGLIVEVTRPRPDELEVRLGGSHTTVRITADAELETDPAITRLPNEVPEPAGAAGTGPWRRPGLLR
jgi:hypothetical protein